MDSDGHKVDTICEGGNFYVEGFMCENVVFEKRENVELN